MSCPSGSKFTADMFEAAYQSLDIWQAMYCAYGTPLGETVVGTLFYGAVSLGIFIKTGSVGIPAILFIVLGSTILAKMLAVVTPFVALIVLLGAPVAATAIVWSIDRLG
jgi:hypothetical protein